MRLALGIVLALAAMQAAPHSLGKRGESDKVRRTRLEAGAKAHVGWKLDETASYFVLSDFDDRSVVHELEVRADELRARFSDDFSTVTCTPGPSFASSTACKSTIRLFSSKESYYVAGGRAGTNSSYDSSTTEILLWAERGAEGRKRLWRELQAGVVVEYFDARLGSDPQAPWILCGLQLVYAPFTARNGGFDVAPDAERLKRVKELLATDQLVALDELLKTSSKKFDDSPDLQAQLWSFVWFLDHAHRGLLSRYIFKWREKHDPDAATSYAFESVNRADLERAWRAYIPTIK